MEKHDRVASAVRRRRRRCVCGERRQRSDVVATELSAAAHHGRDRLLRSRSISHPVARRAAARAPTSTTNRTAGVGPRVRRTEVYAKAYVQMIADRWFRGRN
ncbi:unnamed protein product [Arctia plantaginis]|uniref:Uncharacterized protein n=1 Tax=Arctia plantaginis TaxID=874455 RepID=A0A8S0ZY91_ARCPL|nr:unnamed protein product [Arctia plantaginis]CAB3240571.1 unnamed protein product [Arctia plantaginis]